MRLDLHSHHPTSGIVSGSGSDSQTRRGSWLRRHWNRLIPLSSSVLYPTFPHLVEERQVDLGRDIRDVEEQDRLGPVGVGVGVAGGVDIHVVVLEVVGAYDPLDPVRGV